MAPRARIADDAQRARLLGEERIEGIDDLGDRLHDPEIRGAVDLGRHVDGGDQAAGGAGADGDGLGADGGEQVLLNAARHFGGDRLGQDGARRIGHGHAVGEPVGAEIGDRGDVDQHFAEHDVEDGQRQQLPRQAEATPRRGLPAASRFGPPAVHDPLAVAGSVVHRINRASSARR